ncbi:MAG: hypothetical protein IJH57_00695 [Mogibacterium sp.]|nr:hypothetical protein [Mogibacterium sp.]
MRKLSELVQAISEGRNGAHAFIIEGRAGDARDSFVSDLIEGLGCTEIDIVNMEMSGKTGYSVKDDLPPFLERIIMRPYGKYLSGVIQDAEFLTETAQNKLLKTLEEPPENVLIFLTSARSDELLGTVRSRCSLVRLAEFEGYRDEEDEKADEEMMAGALMLLTQSSPFYEFREFVDKNIKTQSDALHFISIAEERIRKSMTDGKGVKLCAEMIETAEKTVMDITKGMDKNRALKRLYLEFSRDRAKRA